jgi:hypothetical protein
MTLAPLLNRVRSGAAQVQTGPKTSAGRTSRLVRAGLGVAALLVVACVAIALFFHQAVEHQRVQNDLDVAATAFAAARAAGAREFSPGDWKLATTRMDAAMAELHRQDSRFVLIRSYPRVHTLLFVAIDAVRIAKATAEAARVAQGAGRHEEAGTEHKSAWSCGGSTTAKQDALAAVNAVKASLATASTLFARIERCPRARRARELRNDLQTVSRNLDSRSKQIPELDSRYATEDFAGAKAQAETLKAVLDATAKDLEGILTKFKCS